MPPELKKHIKESDIALFGKTKEEKDLLEVWRNNLRGVSYTDKQGNILRGAVDNILVKDGKLIVLDYKTRGYALKEDTHEYYQKQLDIYNFLLQKNGYATENYGYLLFYHPSHVLEGGEVIFNTDLIKMTTNPSSGEKIFKEALKALSGKCPPQHKHKDCEWCNLIEAETD